jgi:hypothetical protein
MNTEIYNIRPPFNNFDDFSEIGYCNTNKYSLVKEYLRKYLEKLISLQDYIYIKDISLCNYSIIEKFNYIIIINYYDNNSIRRMSNKNCLIKDKMQKKTDNKNINYFLYCLIYNLYEGIIHTKGYYGGGGIRDLFLDDIISLNDDNPKIDIDIYITKNKFSLINDDNIIEIYDTFCYRNSIHYLIYNLSKICKIEIELKSINIINRNKTTSICNFNSTIQYTYILNNKLELTIDINALRKYKFCASSTVVLDYNLDYEQNGLILKKIILDSKHLNQELLGSPIVGNTSELLPIRKDFILELSHVREYIKSDTENKNKKLLFNNKYINEYIDSYFPKINIKNNCRDIIKEYIGINYLYKLDIINRIIQKKMDISHMLCCNNLKCLYAYAFRTIDDKISYTSYLENKKIKNHDKLKDYPIRICECIYCFRTFYNLYKRDNKFKNKGYTICNHDCSNKYCAYAAIENPEIIPCKETLYDLFIKNNRNNIFIENIDYNDRYFKLFVDSFCIETNLQKSKIYDHYDKMINSYKLYTSYEFYYDNIKSNILHNSLDEYVYIQPYNKVNVNESILLYKHDKIKHKKLFKSDYINSKINLNQKFKNFRFKYNNNKYARL